MSDSIAALVSEFVGTFMLVLTVGCVSLGKTSANWAPTAIGCTLMVMIYCFGNVSGGHLNPAVSLAAGLSAKMPWGKVFTYIIVQLIAGVAGGFIQSAIYGSTVRVGPGDNFEWWEACIVEVLYTAMLAFVVLSVTSKRNNPVDNPNQFFALAIGFALVAGGYAAGGISGAHFNPAVSIGLDFSNYKTFIGRGFEYALYQVIGAFLASTLFRLTRPEDFTGRASDSAAEYMPSLPTRCASEFLGTFMLVLTVGLSILSSRSPAATPFAAAAVLMSMIYALGDVSGGHFNPAVSLAVAVSRRGGKTGAGGTLAYILIQIIAGILAGLLFAGLNQANTFPLEPKKPYRDLAAYVVEFMFTFLVSYVVLGTATVRGITTKLTRNYYFALAIGLSIAAGGAVSASVSGGAMNPAVSFGVAISHLLNDGGVLYLLTFCLMQLLGGFVAAIAFQITHIKEYAPHEKLVLSS